MFVKDMDAIQSSPNKIDEEQFTKPKICEPTRYKNPTHAVRILNVLQSLREDETLCDIRLKAEDDTIVFGHKVVLVSASPYFRAMFTSSFNESNKDIIDIRDLDSTILKLLVDYIYTGEIIVNEQNVQVLLPAANLLQLDYVNEVCIEFLQAQLDPKNCLGIRAFADLHNCLELFSNSDTYTKKQFSHVVKGIEFLSLSSEEVIKLISSDELNMPSEEKIFECVIDWVKHELGCRHDSLPKLMEHVRLPLASIDYISKEVVEEPLLKNSLQCKDYIIEAFQFHALKPQQLIDFPQTIRCTPRQPDGLKNVFILMSYGGSLIDEYFISFYNIPNQMLKIGLKMVDGNFPNALAVVKEHFVFALGSNLFSTSVQMLDLSSESPCWVNTVDMLVGRTSLGVGVIDDCLYAVGGYTIIERAERLNSVEVFDMSNQKWRMVSSMSTKRSALGVGVLNNILYAVGGRSNSSLLKSVECYDPSIDTWTPVAEMSVCRYGVRVGIVDGVMYAVGGADGSKYLKSVEAYSPSTGVWSFIADMHMARCKPGVVVLDGLLYVIGGRIEDRKNNNPLHSVEIYNPNTNTWSIKPILLRGGGTDIYGVVAVKKPSFISPNEHKQSHIWQL